MSIRRLFEYVSPFLAADMCIHHAGIAFMLSFEQEQKQIVPANGLVVSFFTIYLFILSLSTSVLSYLNGSRAVVFVPCDIYLFI